MNLLWLIPLAPLFAAMLAGTLALTRRWEKSAPYLTIAATLASGAIALQASAGRFTFNWLTIPPGFQIALGVNLDHLAFLMVCVVCVVSALVQVYSIGYMAGETGYARYFAYLGLFTASMLGLVVADNLFQLYVCWELVGICSYLLIGFWWFKPSAANAAKKAFVVTRFGDVGFMLGVLLLVSAAGSFDFGAVEKVVQQVADGQRYSLPLVSPETFLWLVPLLLFCGAIGKSAQFPLHVWLPDAMEGPTPVSALIHAATMVAAGVYMVARLFPLFAGSGIAMNVVLLIGTVTAFLAATIALVQYDIKKVMAYSTVSQLGYMMLGLGAGGQAAGMFHLTTHAMFKALLFLTAGSVIHALQHFHSPSPHGGDQGAGDPNDLRGMGGLLKRMPVTAWTCLIGVLALAGFPGLSGFWSKDAILGAALERGRENPLAMAALIVAVVVAGLTAFYSMRMWMLAFAGKPRSEAAEHAHESPGVMTFPLVLLALASLGLGWFLHEGGRFTAFLTGGEHAAEAMNWGLVGVTTVVALLGLLLGWRVYSGTRAADPVEKIPGYGFLANLWYIDAFWNAVGARGALAVGRSIAWVDRNIVDRYVANGPAWLCGRGGVLLRRTNNGQAQSYAAALIAAVVLVVVMMIWYESRAAPPPASVSTLHRIVMKR
jgi:NADH-quinone oxidoreductase subunit L